MQNIKTILITGSSQGLGFEIAKFLDKSEIQLILTGRLKQKLDYACSQLKYNPISFPLDLSDVSSLKLFIKNMIDQNLIPDIIIHNLGKKIDGDQQPLTVDILRKTMMINLEVAVALNEAFIPHMLEKKWGRIIHISSDSAKTGRSSPGQAASKGAINAYVKSAARYYAKNNIMFCAILPTIFEHENSVWAEKKAQQPDYYQQRKQEMPMERFAHPAELAGFIADIALNPSIMCSGSLIELTGAY